MLAGLIPVTAWLVEPIRVSEVAAELLVKLANPIANMMIRFLAFIVY
jgi:hypothetical protein